MNDSMSRLSKNSEQAGPDRPSMILIVMQSLVLHRNAYP